MWNSVRFLVRDFNGAVSRDKNEDDDRLFDGRGDTDVVGVTFAHMSICCDVLIAKISIVKARRGRGKTSFMDRQAICVS
jgi:hypothetical protein